MTKTKMYIAVDGISPKPTEKKYGYVLECELKGETYTVQGFGKTEGTYHAANITAIHEALERFNRECDIEIHAEDEFVLNMAQMNLQKWSENDFRTTKGKPVANQELWMRLWPLYMKHNVSTVPGTHEYTSWLLGEMRKEK